MTRDRFQDDEVDILADGCSQRVPMVFMDSMQRAIAPRKGRDSGEYGAMSKPFINKVPTEADKPRAIGGQTLAPGQVGGDMPISGTKAFAMRQATVKKMVEEETKAAYEANLNRISQAWRSPKPDEFK